MFDDQPKNESVPGNLPVEQPQDMFAGMEKDTSAPEAPSFPKALDSGHLKKKSHDLSQQDSDTVQMVVGESKSPIIGKIIFGFVILALMGGLGAGGWYGYNFFKNRPPSSVSKQNQTSNNPVVQNSDVAAENRTTNESVLFGEADEDKDKDDLSDADEIKFGTDINKSDTDGDRLSDGDEVKVWRTDPLKADSDGDGYSDGGEIVNGYDPLGPGKYLSPPLAVVRLVTSTASSTDPAFEIFMVNVSEPK